MRDQAGIFVLAAGVIACCAGAPLFIGLVGATGALMLGLAVPALAILPVAGWVAWRRLGPRMSPTPPPQHRVTPEDDPCC